MLRLVLLTAAAVVAVNAQDSSPRSVIVRIGDVTAPGSRSTREVRGGAPFEFRFTSLPADGTAPAIDVTIPGMKAPARLHLHDVTFDRKTFQAKVTLENATGSGLENMRMLITRVTEEIRREGSEPDNRRYLRVDMASPITLGDIPAGSRSDECALTITGFRQGSEAVRTTIEGVILNGRN